MKEALLKERANSLSEKGSIMNGLMAYAQYGEDNPFNYHLNNEEIKSVSSKDLIDIIHEFGRYKHIITYYGPKSLTEICDVLRSIHRLPKVFLPDLPAKKFTYTNTTSNQVFLADYDMIQAEINWLRNGGTFQPELAPKVTLFNNYFGEGMGSVVVQSIRESRALAYSTYTHFASPSKQGREYTMIAYVRTQGDKMHDAIRGMNELLNKLPRSDKSFEAAKANALKFIAAERITKENIFLAYLADKRKGYKVDSRIDLYAHLKQLDFVSLEEFHKEKVSAKPYNYCIVADTKNIDLEKLEKIGNISILKPEQIFKY